MPTKAGRSSSISPLKGRATAKAQPRNRDNRPDARQLAEKAEKERVQARDALQQYVEGVLSRLEDHNVDEIDSSFQEDVENVCKQVM